MQVKITSCARDGVIAVIPRLPADPPVKKSVSCMMLLTAFSSEAVKAGARGSHGRHTSREKNWKRQVSDAQLTYHCQKLH